MTNTPHKASIHWEELDVLRGLAAVFMIVNHTGYKTLAPSQINGDLAGSLLFISSFAPVLFFFVTGVGYGIQSGKKKTSHWHIILNKVAILFLADLLMHWSEGRWLGLDFLGFIGLSSLALEFLRKSRSPLTYAIAGFAAISILRFFLGPHLRFFGDEQHLGSIFNWVFGTLAVPGVSYPLSPWLAYPFAGYIVGVAAMHYKNFIVTKRSRVVSGLLLLSGLPAIAGFILAQHGVSFFRWGTVGLGFYIVSFAVILISLAFSLATGGSRSKICRSTLSLKGISSLAVVPVHYFILELVVILGGNRLNLFWSYLIAIAVLVVSFLLARSIETNSQKLRQAKQQNVIWCGLVAMFLLAAIILLSLSRGNEFLLMLFRTFGQVVLCFLFVIRPQFSAIKLQPMK